MADAPAIVVTAGDPLGIGPEVILKALDALPAAIRHRLVVIGDAAVFERTARRLNRRPPPWRRRHAPGRPTFLHVSPPGSRHPGRACVAYLEESLALWRAGHIRALVTGPVTKWAIRQVRPGFVGQTEYLAEALGVRDVVMMFVSDRLRVALLTRHLPLRRVPRTLTPHLLRQSLRLTAQALRRHFGIARPRLAVCGLNPHAGESAGGSEEQRIMRPALRALRRGGLVCDGPFAADGFFAGASPGRYDAVVCAYHDQGLIPFKMAARDRGCQFSAGLPLIRTAPDHGSAREIAGRGVADCGSMLYAIRLAERLSRA